MIEIKCYNDLSKSIKSNYPELRNFIINYLKKNGLKTGRGFNKYAELVTQFRIAENFDEYLKSFCFMCDSLEDIFKAMKILKLSDTYFLAMYLITNSGSIWFLAEIDLLKEDLDYLSTFYEYCKLK